MTYFQNLTGVDRVTFEGRDVIRTIPVTAPGTRQFSHYNLVVAENDGAPKLRKFRREEIPHLIEREILVIDKGYYSLARQTDRDLYGDQEFRGESKKARARVDYNTFLARRMAYYHRLGMKLTPDGVLEFLGAIEDDYLNYQSLVLYGTQKRNSTQSLKPVPAATTLLEHYRKFRRAGNDPRAFARRSRSRNVAVDQTPEDFRYVLTVLYDYADGTVRSKTEVSEKAVEAVKAENARRLVAGFPAPMKLRSADRYSRWIAKYLDPFVVKMQREGLEAARKEFGSVEKIETVAIPGEQVVFDAWNIHMVTLDTTRDRWHMMTEEQRQNVKRVRRWIVVAIDVATRIILGFALCRNPTLS